MYSPVDTPPEERLKELTIAAKGAEAAILQREVFDDALQKIDEFLEARQPPQALREYRRVLDRYAAAADYRPLSDRLKEASPSELTTRDDSPQEPAPQVVPEISPRVLTLTRRLARALMSPRSEAPSSPWLKIACTGSTTPRENRCGGG